ncbi:lytic transglycosylase domain-containing protein [Aeromonas enteropelogenes]|uniref:lytic transglycosylase domain-containing protein n=1 Tax=Aeromonas enteropelogenes TaxID=29489 RepID=UPI003BA18FDB
MLASHLLLIPIPGWSQTPLPAKVVFVTSEPQPVAQMEPAPQPAPPAGSKQIHVYKSVQQNGVTRYSDMIPEQGHYELLLFNDCFACNPDSRVNWQTTGLFLYDYASTIKAAARAYQVEPALIRALIHAESAFNPLAISRKGAMGLTQLMPATARELGVGNALLAEQNIFGGVKYLAGLLKLYDGNVALATAAYNAGAGAVQKHGGIPPYAETRAYVERVQLLHQRYKEMLQAKGL